MLTETLGLVTRQVYRSHGALYHTVLFNAICAMCQSC